MGKESARQWLANLPEHMRAFVERRKKRDPRAKRVAVWSDETFELAAPAARDAVRRCGLCAVVKSGTGGVSIDTGQHVFLLIGRDAVLNAWDALNRAASLPEKARGSEALKALLEMTE